MPIDPRAPFPTDPIAVQADKNAGLQRRVAALERRQVPTGKAWRNVGDPDEPAFGTLFENPSTPTLAPCQFLRDAFGFVHLRGVAIANSAGANFIFQLPEGYRPAVELYLSTFYFDFNGVGAPKPGYPLVITSDGQVKAYSSLDPNDQAWLDVTPFWSDGP